MTQSDILRDLVEPLTPTASVYFGPEPAEVRRRELRWRAVAKHLADQGADPATIEAAGASDLVAGPVPLPCAVIARAGEVAYGQPMPGAAPPVWAPGRDLVRFAELPDVAPLLAWRQQRPGYLLVIIDRAGADLTAVPAGALDGRSISVDGPDDEIERNAPGGWSQPRYQRRAEDSWQHNAAAVAQAVGEEWDRLFGGPLSAGLLLLGGDVRAVQLLAEQLPEGVRHAATVRHVPGGRSADGSEAVRAAAIDEARAAYAAAATETMLREELPAGMVHNGATSGVADTVAALAAGRVRTLLAVADPDDTRRAWYGDRVLCAPDGPGAAEPGLRPGRLLDVALRAALLTDAEVRLLPPDGLPEGFAAICRF